MATLFYQSGPLLVSVKHLWQKRKPDGPYYYRRRIPKEVLALNLNLKGPYKTVALKTKDLTQATKLIVQQTRRDDEEWQRISDGVTPSDSYGEAGELLAKFGLDAIPSVEQQDRELGLHLFTEHLERKVPGDEHPVSHLASHEMRAIRILKGEDQPTLSDAKHVYMRKRDYLEVRPDNRKQRNLVDSAFGMIVELLGDRELKSYKRADVTDLIHAELAAKRKTATIKRRLGVVRAAVNDLIKERELDGMRNPFADFEIPKLGEDAEQRTSLTPEQVGRIREYVSAMETDTANIMGMLLDTGARVAEVAGLWLEDVVLDTEIPHVTFHENPLRRLKTKQSARMVPLVGSSLKAARRAVATADGEFLFNRYMSKNGVKNDAASSALRKVMSGLDCETPHWMRHTMRTRLRNADVPEPRAKEIQGWSRESIADQYGEQTALRNLKADLEKTL
jgi:integrase